MHFSHGWKWPEASGYLSNFTYLNTRSGVGHQIEKKEEEREGQKEMAAAAAAAGHTQQQRGKGAEPDQRNTACIQLKGRDFLFTCGIASRSTSRLSPYFDHQTMTSLNQFGPV